MAELGWESEQPPGRAFERRVGMLFELHGFRVEPNRLIAGRQVDLFLEARNGPLARLYIVECKDQASPVSTAQYDAFRGRLNAARHEISPKLRGIIVASVGFVKEAKAQALHEDIELLTISELESSVIDFRQYARDLIRRLEHDPALTYFVPPRCVREHLTVSEPASNMVGAWLADSEANQLTLLGDYGTGKTTFLKHLALELAHRYEREVIEGGARGRVPILVDLREYTQALSLKQIVLDLLDNHGIRAASYGAFEYVLREGQVLLILDGFDEMASRGNYHVTLRNFRELNRSALGKAKIILSCRSHYFTDQRDVQKFLGRSGLQEIPVFYTDLYREVAGRPNFLIAYLQEFDSEQVAAYVESRCGDQAKYVREFISRTYNLEELSRRPVLLDMIVGSAGNLSNRTEPITPAILYRIFTDIWLARNDWSTILDVDTKRELLERFAAKAIVHEDAQLHYSEIPRLIRSWRQGVTDLDEQEIDRELRTATFLVRNQSGEYRFSHRSFLEFFYSQFLLSAAGQDDFKVWGQAPFRTEIYRFVQDLLALPAPRSTLDRILALIRDPEADIRARGRLIKCVSRVQEPGVADALLEVLKIPGDLQVRCFAATSLGYQRRPEVVEALIRIARDDNEEMWVRANSLLALVRLDMEKGMDFLLLLLEPGRGDRTLRSPEASMIFRAAHAASNMNLVRACIRYARHRHDNPKITLLGLELCAACACNEGEELCEEILGSTEDPKMARLAFSALPFEKRWPYLDRIFRLVENWRDGRDAQQTVRSLRGMRCPEVAAFLVRVVENTHHPYEGYFSPVEQEALEVIAADYPNIVLESAAQWVRQRRSQQFKLQLATAYVAQHPPDGAAFLRALFTRRSRAVHKRSLLDLLYLHYRDSFANFVRDVWVGEPATLVKRHALELLLQVDRKLATKLMLDYGVQANRVGTRVAVCMILASIPEKRVTAALMERLRLDPSRWVRLQALRSLAAPGRAVDRRQLWDATQGEKDTDVLALRLQLLGT